MKQRIAITTWCLSILVLTYSLVTSGGLQTPDQRGYSLFTKAEYQGASQAFSDSYWRAVALYRDGAFEDAAGIFAGFDTAEGCFNHGNALLFHGKYHEAAKRYERALEHRPAWEDAIINREIALARAAALEFEGGDMTGGKMGADDYVINSDPNQNQSDNEQTETVESTELSDAELRAVWLRQVQTDPADFLRSKFSYQLQQQGGSR